MKEYRTLETLKPYVTVPSISPVCIIQLPNKLIIHMHLSYCINSLQDQVNILFALDVISHVELCLIDPGVFVHPFIIAIIVSTDCSFISPCLGDKPVQQIQV